MNTTETSPTPTKPTPAKAAVDITFAIYPRSLLAMRLLQSKDESRYVLNGVHFEIQPNGQVLLIATNGRFIGILKADAIVTSNVKETVEFTVDYPFVRYLPKPGSTEFDRILCHYNGEEVEFTSGAETITHKVIVGDYPKWRTVVPTTPFAPFEISVNAEYVARFQKVAKLLGDRNSSEGVILKGHAIGTRAGTRPDDRDPYAPYSVFIPGLHDQEFYGAIMPLRTNGEFLEMPKWLGIEKAKPEESKPYLASEAKPAPAPPTTAIAILQPGTEGKHGKTYIGTSDEPPKGIGSVFPRQEGFSYWIEWGKWFKAPTVDGTKFGPHDYDDGGTGGCKCGCHMGDCSSSGPVDPFGPCPLNFIKTEEPAPVAEPAEVAVPHPIIPPSTKERKTNVHKHNTRPRKNLDRSRRHRHGKAGKNLHVQRRQRR